MRVLLVEDDDTLGDLVMRRLAKAGLVADRASSGARAVALAQSTSYDVILLDVMLGPGIDGVQACSEMRSRGVSTPILMLTALGDVERRVEALNGGADDYVTKPFDFRELLARIHALGRRGEVSRSTELVCVDLRLDPVAHRVWRGEEEVRLARKEFLILEALMRHPGQVLSRQQLIEAAWDTEYEARSNVVDVSVGYLRDKIDRPFDRNTVETVRGVGYRLRCEG